MRTCRASTDWRGPEQRTGQQQPERSHRIGSGGRALGIEFEEPAERPRRPCGILQPGTRRSEDQKTTSFPPGLSYQSLARFLGREFPVILEEKLSQRVERLRVIGIGEPGPFIGLEGEIHLSGPTQRPAEEKEILGVHVLERIVASRSRSPTGLGPAGPRHAPPVARPSGHREPV